MRYEIEMDADRHSICAYRTTEQVTLGILLRVFGTIPCRHGVLPSCQEDALRIVAAELQACIDSLLASTSADDLLFCSTAISDTLLFCHNRILALQQFLGEGIYLGGVVFAGNDHGDYVSQHFGAAASYHVANGQLKLKSRLPQTGLKRLIVDAMGCRNYENAWNWSPQVVRGHLAAGETLIFSSTVFPDLEQIKEKIKPALASDKRKSENTTAMVLRRILRRSPTAVLIIRCDSETETNDIQSSESLMTEVNPNDAE